MSPRPGSQPGAAGRGIGHGERVPHCRLESVRVTSAHARADRREAALVREIQDMAQARLLIVHEVDMPDQPQSFRFYRIDNRSKDLFFDVKVPFVERYYQSDTEIDRLTPESAANTLEFLPDGVLRPPTGRKRSKRHGVPR